jgi:hypothetical protein
MAVQYQMKKTIESNHINVDLQKYSSGVWSWSVNTLIRINLGHSEHSIRQWKQRKVVCVHVMKAYGESGSTAPHFPKLDTRWKNVDIYPRPLYPGKSPGTHWMGGWTELRRFKKRNLCPN